MIEVNIESIGISPMNYQRVVLLKEQAGERYLPIWIGPAEADAIAVKLQGVDVPRPLSHDLLWSVIGTLKASVNSIIINDLRDDTFYGRIILNTGDGQVEVDARPSDALALAIRARAPIFAEDAVLDEAAILIDRESPDSTLFAIFSNAALKFFEGVEIDNCLSAFKTVIPAANSVDI